MSIDLIDIYCSPTAQKKIWIQNAQTILLEIRDWVRSDLVKGKLELS